MLKKFLVLIFALFINSTVLAFSSFVVKEIRIEGIERISQGAVLNKLHFKVGDTLSPDETGAIVKNLFSSGYFSSVNLFKDGDTLIISVVENPAIGKIVAEGNSKLSSKQLREVLKSLKIEEGLTYSVANLSVAKMNLEYVYYGLGMYAVKIVTTVEELQKGSMKIKFTITEGRATKIKKINIIGNKEIKDSELARLMSSGKSTLLSSILKNDQYSKQRVAADLEVLTDFYFNKGYLDFKVLSTQTSITEDKRSMYLTININEGQKYKVGAVNFMGKLIITPEKAKEAVNIKTGEYVSRGKLLRAVDALKESIGEHGYILANINPVENTDPGTHTTNLTFYVEPGDIYYVRKINFRGNDKSKDELLRRNVQQFEGSQASAKLIRDSKFKLNNSGYFSGIEVEKQIVSTSNNEVDLLWKVTESSLANVQFGLAYDGIAGLTGNVKVHNENLLGGGNTIDALADIKGSSKLNLNFGFKNPHINPEGMSRSIDLSYASYDASGNNNIAEGLRSGEFKSYEFGAGVMYGVPITLNTRWDWGGGYHNVNINSIVGKSTATVLNFVTRNGKNPNDTSRSVQEPYLSTGFSYSSLNKVLFPTEGWYAGISIKGILPVSDIPYYTVGTAAKYFKPIAKNFVFYFDGKIKYGNTYWGNTEYPYYANFNATGSDAPRTYSSVTGATEIGSDPNMKYAFGGNLLVKGSTGIVLPSFFGFKSDNMRFSVFLDGGMVYSTTQTFSISSLRYSCGFAVDWIAPMIGPINFGIGIPLNNKKDSSQGVRDGDSVSSLVFGAGFSF